MSRMIYQVETDHNGNPKGFKPKFTRITACDLTQAKGRAEIFAASKAIIFTEDWQEHAGANFRRGQQNGKLTALMISR